jgi:hypothetical protein
VKPIMLSYTRGAQNVQKSRSHLKILGARRVTWSKFHAEAPQISHATATWHSGFVHPWVTQSFFRTQVLSKLGDSSITRLYVRNNFTLSVDDKNFLPSVLFYCNGFNDVHGSCVKIHSDSCFMTAKTCLFFSRFYLMYKKTEAYNVILSCLEIRCSKDFPGFTRSPQANKMKPQSFRQYCDSVTYVNVCMTE